MVHPQVADEDGLQMYRVAMNIPQLQRADKSDLPAWGLGRE
jgi:hypothetical protein